MELREFGDQWRVLVSSWLDEASYFEIMSIGIGVDRSGLRMSTGWQKADKVEHLNSLVHLDMFLPKPGKVPSTVNGLLKF